MKTPDKNSFSLKTQSIFLALACLIVFNTIFFVLDDLVHSFDKASVTAYFLFGLLSAIACLLIIEQNPKSIWYVPLIINSQFILAAFIEPFFWRIPPDASGIPTWTLVCSGWILTIIASIIGATLGRKTGVTGNHKVN